MILFDYSHALHRTCRVNVEEINANIDIVAHLALSQITSYAQKLGASRENPFVIAMDSKPSWRHDYYIANRHKFDDIKDQTYKGNRVDDGKLPWKEIHEVSDTIMEALEKYSDFYVLKIDKCEADDIIAVLAEGTVKHTDNHKVWVVSSDKDFVQLQGDRVKIFDPIKQQFKPDVDVAMYKTIHTIIGDTVDNIPAIKPRTKEKTAVKMVPDLDHLLATNPSMKARWDFNEDLILFEKIPANIRRVIMQGISKQKFSYDSMSLMKIFMKYGVQQHSENIGAFRLPNMAKSKLITELEEAKRNAKMSDSNLDAFFN